MNCCMHAVPGPNIVALYTRSYCFSLRAGGDWTLERSAVVFLEGTMHATVTGCVFERVDGNAIMMSAYNRNGSITHNEFAWIGATAVAMWGNTDGGDARWVPGVTNGRIMRVPCVANDRIMRVPCVENGQALRVQFYWPALVQILLLRVIVLLRSPSAGCPPATASMAAPVCSRVTTSLGGTCAANWVCGRSRAASTRSSRAARTRSSAISSSTGRART